MAKAISTAHYAPDVRDEGLIKRYGISIAIAFLAILLAAFVIWATAIGLQNQYGPAGPSPAQSGQTQS